MKTIFEYITYKQNTKGIVQIPTKIKKKIFFGEASTQKMQHWLYDNADKKALAHQIISRRVVEEKDAIVDYRTLAKRANMRLLRLEKAGFTDKAAYQYAENIIRNQLNRKGKVRFAAEVTDVNEAKKLIKQLEAFLGRKSSEVGKIKKAISKQKAALSSVFETDEEMDTYFRMQKNRDLRAMLDKLPSDEEQIMIKKALDVGMSEQEIADMIKMAYEISENDSLFLRNSHALIKRWSEEGNLMDALKKIDDVRGTDYFDTLYGN